MQVKSIKRNIQTHHIMIIKGLMASKVMFQLIQCVNSGNQLVIKIRISNYNHYKVSIQTVLILVYEIASLAIKRKERNDKIINNEFKVRQVYYVKHLNPYDYTMNIGNKLIKPPKARGLTPSKNLEASKLIFWVKVQYKYLPFHLISLFFSMKS